MVIFGLMTYWKDRRIGLTWSAKWHLIDQSRSDKEAVSRCGAYLYTPEEIREKKSPRHLLTVVDNPDSAPLCKKCEKAEIKDGAVAC